MVRCIVVGRLALHLARTVDTVGTTHAAVTVVAITVTDGQVEWIIFACEFREGEME